MNRHNLSPSTVIGIDHKFAIVDTDPTIRKVLPPVFVDGPFGGASKDIFQFEVAVVCALGSIVEPYASILKSVWYRINCATEKTQLGKIYFVWSYTESSYCKWFASLLLAIEAQDMDHNIEICTVSELAIG